MKKCTVSWFSKIFVLFLVLILFLPTICYAIYQGSFSPNMPLNERCVYFVGAFIFGGFTVFFIYRILYLGFTSMEYDEKSIIFHHCIPHKEEYRFRWEEIPGSNIQLVRRNNTYMFIIYEDKKYREIPLNRFSRGYDNLIIILKETGVLERSSIITSEQMKQYAEKIWKDYFGETKN